jgi:hypothetical protein
MKRLQYVIALLLIAFTGTPILSAEQEGTYVRKSISGPNALWANTSTLEAIGNKLPELEATIKESVRIPRFDLNRLPETLFETARESLKYTEMLTNDTLSKTIKTTVVPEIEKILNDPEIQKRRIEIMKRGKQKVSFAETKGKASNVLSSDLETLFNSAYIYIPFAKKFETTNNGVVVVTTISTGVAWYKMSISGSGKTSLTHLKTISVKATARKLINYNSKEYLQYGDRYIDYLFEKSQELAIENAGQKIKLEIKKIEDFTLAGIVKEADGSEYRLNIGTLEGLKLDDAYVLMGYVDEDGLEVEKELGFLRITEVNDNQEDPNNFSTAQQQLGALQSSGGWVKEYPRTKTHVAFGMGYATGLNIDSGEIPELKENATSAVILEGTLAQNLSETFGVPQLFGEIAASLGVIENTLDSGVTGTTLLTSVYINIKKKYWHRRHSTHWKVGAGYDNFRMSGTRPNFGGSADYEYNIRALGFTFGVGYEMLLTKNLSMTLNTQYKFTPFKTKASGNNNDGAFDYDASGSSDTFSETHFGGAQFTFGFNYIFQ